ncbi:hypothetical protein ASD11_01240 [Aeromicrobium sp. Root495]|uniref:hypothetical protein n=1 Tax=Aeromicrobium sp. Root495 TaxID=1736550 RepID=UPI0006FBD68A|nr:hypothetical protein [Aeromicrobium sp. Root495]KQY58320.1 hypothetical protein ASD11_01240 [Aeromicrobium sp. Root495]
MSARDTVGMITVDGIRYRPEEAKALELEPSEPTPVVDPYAEASAQAKAQAEADAAELEQLRAASTPEGREQAEKDAAELEALRSLVGDPEKLQAKLDEHAASAKAGAVTTAAAQPANKARTPRGKGA